MTDAVLRADALSNRRRMTIFGAMMLASFAYNFSFIVIDIIRPYLVRDGVMTLAQTALLYTAQSTGVMVGSFLIPPFCSRLGNKRTLLFAAAALSVGSALNIMVDSFAVWFAVRFLVGVTLAGCYIASITMLANLAPPHIRGRLLSVNMAMFSIAQIIIGGLGTVVGGEWRIMVGVASGLGAATVALTMLLVPDDRGMIVYANDERAAVVNEQPGRWGEMLQGRRKWFALACILLAGLNFSSYQFYSGFITTYLLNVRGLAPETIALFAIVDGVGGLAGTIMFGLAADRFGRKPNLWGFPVGALAIAGFLLAPTYVPLMLAIEMVYALALSCTNCWAAYFAELFPVRLRPMGTSLFHGGHVVSLFAPVIVATVAAFAPLAVGMALAPASLLIATFIWSRLPETLQTGRLYRGYNAEAHI